MVQDSIRAVLHCGVSRTLSRSCTAVSDFLLSLLVHFLLLRMLTLAVGNLDEDGWQIDRIESTSQRHITVRIRLFLLDPVYGHIPDINTHMPITQ